MPKDLDAFKIDFDLALQSLNTDYKAKRHNNMAMTFPIFHITTQDVFRQWLEGKHKLGGQHKVPRLANNRKIFDEIFNKLKII